MLFKKAISVLFLIIAIWLTFHPLSYGDRSSEILREVIVMFKAGVLQLPKGLDSGGLDQIQIFSPQVKSILQKHRAEMIVKAFPDFELADTLGFTPDGRPVYLCDLSEIYKIRLPESSKRDGLIRDLATLTEVVYAEPNGIAQPAAPVYPNDLLFEQGYQWGLYNYGQGGGTVDADIYAPEAWEIFTGSSGVKIGIIDGGVENWHEDLSGKVSGDGGWGWEGHGFHVAGIAAAKTDNDTGIAGVDWNARIISQRIDNTDDEGTYDAIMDAVNAGADVLNNSWGLDPPGRYSTTVRLAFANAYKLNRVVVVAMGNDSTSQTQYPAGFGQGIIAVGATTRNDVKAGFSNWGNHIDVTAPGVYIMSCVPYQTEWGYYEPWSGTSMAAPHVSGLASLLKGYKPDLYNDDIEQIIRISADNIVTAPGDTGWDEYTGTGRINARKAFDLLGCPNLLAQWSVSGGYIASVTGHYTQVFFGVPGLANGVYIVKRYEMRNDVTFPRPFEPTPHVWGRGVATIGYSAANPNFGMGDCDVISADSTVCTLRTWVYEIWDFAGDPVGWRPCAPGDVSFTYTVLGEPALLAPTISVRRDDIDNRGMIINWTDNNLYEQGYKVERKTTSGTWEQIATTSANATEYLDIRANLVGSETYYYRVRAFNGTLHSPYSNEVNIKNRPNPARNLSGYVVKVKIYYYDKEFARQSPYYPDDPPLWDSVNTTKIVLNWQPPANQKDSVYYKIYYRYYKDGVWSWTWYELPEIINDTTYTRCWVEEYTVYFKILAVDFQNDPAWAHSSLCHVTTGNLDTLCPTTVEPPPEENELTFSQNYPNPFNPQTQITFNLPQGSTVNLDIYNILGQRIITLLDEEFQPGEYSITWEGKNENGEEVSSGVYFYRIKTKDYTEVKKMILLK